MDHSENPYASPRAEEQVNKQVPYLGIYQAQLMPREPFDLILLLLGICVGIAINLLGAVIAWLLSFNPIIGVLFVVLMACFLCFFGIRTVSIEEDGLNFRRYYGGSQKFCWGKIQQIRMATRSEVIRMSLFKPWCICAFSGTLRGHVRVVLSDRSFIFPPRECELFCESIRVQMSKQQDLSY